MGINNAKVNKIYVYLAIYGFDDPAMITEMMGIKPTESWIKGEHYSSKHPSAIKTHSRWKLSSGLSESASLEAHLEALLCVIEPLKEKIQQVKALFPISITAAMYLYETNSLFRLNENILQRLSALKLELHLDQYHLSASN